MKELREDLVKKLEEWKASKLPPGLKSYKYDSSPYLEGEFIVTLSINVKLNLKGSGQQAMPMDLSKRFFTVAQNNPELPPEGDLHLLKLVLDKFDLEFQERLDNTISSTVSI